MKPEKKLTVLESPPSYELASSTWDAKELDAAIAVLRAGRTTMGEKVLAFERAFAARLGARYAVMVNSGSSANLVAVAALAHRRKRPLKAGDEVIVPAISWATTYYPLHQYGLKLKFVDVDRETLNIDVKQLKKALTKKTRAIVAVSILGNPCELDKLRKFADDHELAFFEDNCESMGATLNGKECGTFGDINTFSSFFSHHISTMEGGMVVTDDEELYQLSKCLRAHGWTRELGDSSLLHERRSDDFNEAYRFLLPGYNVRPLEISGAIGLEQLKKLDGMIEQRRRNAAVFQQLFGNDKRFLIQKENGKSSWFCFTMIVRPESKIDRSEVFAALKKQSIGFRMITGGNFVRHEVIKHIDHAVVGKLVNADLAHDRGFFVGNHPRDLTAELHRLHEALSVVGK